MLREVLNLPSGPITVEALDRICSPFCNLSTTSTSSDEGFTPSKPEYLTSPDTTISLSPITFNGHSGLEKSCKARLSDQALNDITSRSLVDAACWAEPENAITGPRVIPSVFEAEANQYRRALSSSSHLP